MKIRLISKHGQNHPKAILSDHEVEQLRYFREVECWSYNKLALVFEISKNSVVRICKYRTR